MAHRTKAERKHAQRLREVSTVAMPQALVKARSEKQWQKLPTSTEEVHHTESVVRHQLVNDGSIFDSESILDDSYPIYADYLYVADGRVVRSDVQGSVRTLRHVLKATEIRRCNIFARIAEWKRRQALEPVEKE